MLNLSTEAQALIAEYNTNGKLNSFLYQNKDCHELFKTFLEGEYSDRFILVRRKNNIERELISYIHENFHGKKVEVTDNFGQTFKGVIEHELTRTYNDGTQITDNKVCFRFDEVVNKMGVETVSLWVNTGEKDSTHLYSINNITLI